MTGDRAANRAANKISDSIFREYVYRGIGAPVAILLEPASSDALLARGKSKEL